MDRTERITRVSHVLVTSAIFSLLLSGGAMPAAFAKSGAGDTRQGDAASGRSIFNGKGICYYCHGVDGNRNQLPQLEPQTVELISQLNPRPPDLRNSKALKLKTDQARRTIIREGHEGTGMFPDVRMTDRELADVVAYLAVLRQSVPAAEASPTKQASPEGGRSVFNGKGICYYCHGVDGHGDQLPELEPKTVELISQLNPRPPDLRNPKTLRLKTDQARRTIIREGHVGTGMFPDVKITDQELADVVAYLAVLRRSSHVKEP